jgi:phosphoesterase RecJ-like protein
MDALRPRFEAVRASLEGAGVVVVTGHEAPDGDAVGAVAALRRHLDLEGVRVEALLTDPLSPRYGFMEFAHRHEVFDPAAHTDLVMGADVVVVCDLSHFSRLGPMRQCVEEGDARTICFDHHPCEGGGPADVNVLDDRATATGSLVYDYIRHVGGEVDREIAESVFVSLATDTGWFRYPNTDAKVLELAAELAAYRLDLPGMYRAIYQSHSAPMLRLLGHVARSMNEECDGALVWSVVRRELMDDLGVERYDADPILDVLRTRELVQVVALFTEREDGSQAVSLRSRGDPDVNLVARRYGGGGHKYSAGTMLPTGQADDLRRFMLADLRRLLTESVA